MEVGEVRDDGLPDGDHRPQGAAREAVQYLRQINGERHRPDGEEQSTEAEGADAEEADAGLAARRIHQRAGRELARHRREGAEAEGEADGRVGPALGGQIDGDEGPETGLDIGDEEIEEIERASRPGIHGPRNRHAGIQGRLPLASGGMRSP